MQHNAVVVIIIRDQQGNYFVHRRRPEKKIFPGKYGLGAGGRVEDSEGAQAAAVRELAEETGLQADPQHVLDMPYNDGTVAHLVHLFELYADRRHLKPDWSEWDWSGWLSPTEVDQLATENLLCPDTAQLYQLYQKT